MEQQQRFTAAFIDIVNVRTVKVYETMLHIEKRTRNIERHSVGILSTRWLVPG